MNFFKPYKTYILGKGVVETSNYIGALRSEGFTISSDNVEIYLRNPKGELVFTHIKCLNYWNLFLSEIPKCLLPLKTLLKYVDQLPNATKPA